MVLRVSKLVNHRHFTAAAAEFALINAADAASSGAAGLRKRGGREHYECENDGAHGSLLFWPVCAGATVARAG
jgi:hypothetical protein